MREVTLLYLLNRLEFIFKNRNDPITSKDLNINYEFIKKRLFELQQDNDQKYRSSLQQSFIT